MLKKREQIVNENYYFPLLSRTNLTFLVLFIKRMYLFFQKETLGKASPASRIEENAFGKQGMISKA
jgi:hypothetical protein